ncbi:MAG: DUF2834 domain-containing protein, partial [Minicystis sp.]
LAPRTPDPEGTIMDGKSKALCVAYGLISAAALVATWSQNIAFMRTPDNGGLMGFIQATNVNAAARSIGLDLAFVCLAAFVWMVVEARRLKIRFVGIYLVLSCVIAVSVMFPLFLIAREMRLSSRT